MMTTTITIALRDFAQFQREIAKLQRRAEKLGVKPIEIVKVSAIRIENIAHENFVHRVEVADIEIDGNPPSYSGWTFAASVETLESGKNIFHGTDKASLPPRFYDSGHTCEHCNQNRRRNASYILRHEDGNFSQVGSTCINDFLGGNALPAFQLIKTFREICGRMEDSLVHRGNEVVNVLEVLTVAANVISERGFVKKGGYDAAFDDGAEPTSFIVERALFPIISKDRVETTDSNSEKAEAVRDWLVNMEGEQNDYIQKLIDLAASNHAHKRNIGILVSAISAHDREIEKIAMAEKSTSTHVGRIGERGKFDLALINTRILPDYGYGSPTLFTFEDVHGNFIKWKSSKAIDIPKAVTLIGTIRKHGEWNGIKETELTRCKVVS